MADRLEASVLIDKPVEDVFAFLNTPQNHPRFVPGMIEFRTTTPGPLGQVGTTVQGVRRFLGGKMLLPYEITEYEPNSRLAMKGIMGPIHFNDGYVLEAAGRSTTRVNFWLELTLTGLMKLADPIMKVVGRTHAQETLDNLKRALETTE